MPNWGWLLLLGVLTVLAGIVLLTMPGLTTLALAIMVGWVLVLLGIGGVVVGIKSVRPSRRWGDIALGVLTFLLGLYTLLFPLSGAISLTVAITAWLFVRGGLELVAAMGGGQGRMRGLLAVSGVLDLILAVLLFVNLPFPAVQYVGIAVGVSLLFSGVLTAVAAFGLRRGGPGAAFSR